MILPKVKKVKLIKLITFIAFIASVLSIICGYYLKVTYHQKLIGFGVAGLFFVVFPLFSFYRWRNKDPKNYMLTKENLDKMRQSQKNNNN